MIFNSYLFVLLFLPLIILGFYFIIYLKKYRSATFFLLFSSFIFYGYGNILALILLMADILINYTIHKVMNVNKNTKTLAKLLLGIGIIFNLIMLLYFKYYNFFIDNINAVFGADLTIRNIILPLGISFITFQQIAFLLDTYRNETSDYKLLDYALFVSYFPHVGSGPIILHNEFFPSLSNVKKMDWNQFASGLYMFAMGLGKKVIIADTFAKSVDWGYSNISALNSTSAVFITIAYSIQIYFDFSGYSDMAIGISKMLQINLPINFNSPYKSATIIEFWNRWHMTLTRFLTKYLYISLGGNRKGKLRTYLNILIIFFCSGLWHGANWTFILWGLLHGLFMIFTRHFKNIIDKIPRVINMAITLLFVNFTWVLFRSESFATFKLMIKSILQNNWGKLNSEICELFVPNTFNDLLKTNAPYWIWVILFTFITLFIILKCKNTQEKANELKYTIVSSFWIITVLLLSILSFSGVTSFVYSRF